ncbi:MAG TPA: hypothetical protein VKG83_11420 [Mycobacterium sp.]|nr:hypothetical protein [Mycobacterium sp.]
MIRPAEFSVHVGPIAVLDGRVCAALSRLLNLDKLRAQVRGQDAEVDQALLAIRLAALKYNGTTSATGSKSAPVAEAVRPSPQHESSTFSTTTAAGIAGIGPRAIRQAIAEKRLAATKDDGGRHRITPADLAAYAATRARR